MALLDTKVKMIKECDLKIDTIIGTALLASWFISFQ